MCQDCEAGKYLATEGNDAATDCTLCGEGKYSATSGASEAAACIDCLAGKYAAQQGSNEESDCILCGMGKYSTETGATEAGACQSCIAGKFSATRGNDAESDCQACGAGKYSEMVGSDSESNCVPCGAGQVLDAIWREFRRCVCLVWVWKIPEVHRAVNQRMIVPAAVLAHIPQSPGLPLLTLARGAMPESTRPRLALSLHATCLSCGAGKYSASTGSQAEADCISCGAGTYSTLLVHRQRDVYPCAAGKFSSAEANSAESDCVVCASGTYSSALGAVDVSTCQPCAAGKYLHQRRAMMRHQSACCADLARSRLSLGPSQQHRARRVRRESITTAR